LRLIASLGFQRRFDQLPGAARVLAVRHSCSGFGVWGWGFVGIWALRAPKEARL